MTEPPTQHLNARLEDGVLVLRLTGEHLQDERAAHELLQELGAMVDHYRARQVVVDLENIRYISSVAFRPLLNLRRKLVEAKGRLILCNLSSVVGDVFYTTRLVSPTGSFHAPFEMEKDVASAITALKRDAWLPE
jgi:anti-sigma B factor antagonist